MGGDGTRRARSAAAAWLGVLVLAGGCNSYTVELAAPATLAPQHQFRVGAAREEITPIPGVPMGGYGFIGKTARGFWTRLWANALVLEDGDGTPLVLVSCDLWSMPGGLGDEVVARVQADPRGQGIGREHVVIAATHTHQSPGAYSSSVGYNVMAAPTTGYDPALFDFLAGRISRAILRAAAARAPATMHWRDGYLTRFVRNRALPAFVRNPEDETADFLGTANGAPYCDLRTPVADRAACRAVDATVTVVRFERAGAIVGAAVFAALHPTAVGNDLAVYSSDVFGVAGIHATQRLRHGDTIPILAFFNGAEGDVSPDWRMQDGPNALTLGRRLADEVVALASGGTSVRTPTIRHAFARVTVAGACRTDTDGDARCAASRPMVGRATLAGATDGRTHSLPWLFREGVTRTALGPQGVKVPALDPGIGWLRLPLSWLLMLPVRGPTAAPLGVYRLGPLAIATLPGEFTTMMGRRIAQSVARALPSAERVLLAGLANAYLSYFTTPEEYAGQFYEGASTLYGPESGPIVEDALTRLAIAVESGDPRPPATRESIAYTPGPTRAFGLDDVDVPSRSDAGLARLLREPPYDDVGPPYPSICWRGLAPMFPDVHLPRVLVEIGDTDGTTAERWRPLPGADNAGTQIVTVASARPDGDVDWRALWMPPPDVADDARLRLTVIPLAGAPVHGAPFALDDHELVSGCDTP
jgi:neutral ceramidase